MSVRASRLREIVLSGPERRQRHFRHAWYRSRSGLRGRCATRPVYRPCAPARRLCRPFGLLRWLHASKNLSARIYLQQSKKAQRLDSCFVPSESQELLRLLTMLVVTSDLGQSLPNWAARATSAFPPLAATERTSRDVSNVPPIGDISGLDRV